MKKIITISVLLAIAAPGLRAAVELPSVLSSHMVLQREIPVPVWGKASPGEKITVEFRGQTKATVADAKGGWLVKLDPLTASAEPAVLTVSGENKIELEDVLVGEVWLGSGQSNMDIHVSAYGKDDAPMSAALRDLGHGELRLHFGSAEKGWRVAESKLAIGFSAELFYFGAKLREALGVPVGLIVAAVPGTTAERWITQDMLQADAAAWRTLTAFEQKNPLAQRKQEYAGKFEQWKTDYATALAAGVEKSKLPKKPGQPQPVAETNPSRGDLFAQRVSHFAPFALRGVLWDQGEGGPGAIGVALDQRSLMAALIRGWRQAWGQGDFAWLYVQKPSGLGCALDPSNPVNKGAPLSVAELPPEPHSAQTGSVGSPRFDYWFIKDDNPGVFMVAASDLEPGIHPRNKSGYGARACQVALGAVYGKPVEYYGPIYESHTVSGGTLTVKFSHTGKGLTTPQGQQAQGFAIAGADGKFYWATARLDGNTVLLSCPDVPQPVAASYAWAPYDISWANLFNQDGLPAHAFKTK